jgi:hypothetical protein
MNICLSRYFRPAAIRFSLATLIAALSYGSAGAQISTSATLSLSPQPIYQGTAPVATVAVTASDGSSPNSSATCTITTRGHVAAYSANVVSGTATMLLSSLAQVPVGTYSLTCTYVGSSSYAESSAPTKSLQVLAVTPSTTSASASSTQFTQGTAPTATVSVTVSGNSNPPGNVSCIVRARGHVAAYGASLGSGSANITLTNLAHAPVGTYPLICSYPGAGQYGASSAASVDIQVVKQP